MQETSQLNNSYHCNFLDFEPAVEPSPLYFMVWLLYLSGVVYLFCQTVLFKHHLQMYEFLCDHIRPMKEWWISLWEQTAIWVSFELWKSIWYKVQKGICDFMLS